MTIAQRIAIRRSIQNRQETIAAEAAAEAKHQARLARRGFFARRTKAAKAA